MQSAPQGPLLPSSEGSDVFADKSGVVVGQLMEALKIGNISLIGGLLDELHQMCSSNTVSNAPVHSLLRIWAACQGGLEGNLDPKVCTSALKLLCTLAQLCVCSGQQTFESWQLLNLPLTTSRTSACMKRHTKDYGLQAAGCALFARLAGCSFCGKSHNIELLQAVFADAMGCIMPSVLALQAPIEPSEASNAALFAAEALSILRFLVLPTPAYAAFMLELQGQDLVRAALTAGKVHPSAELNALLLFGAIACQEKASEKTIESCLTTVVELAEAQVATDGIMSDATAAAAACSMARCFRFVCYSRSSFPRDTLTYLAHRAAGPLMKMLAAASSKDANSDAARHCLDAITVICAGMSSLPPAFSSPAAVLAVATHAATTSTSGALCAAVRTLWCMLSSSNDDAINWSQDADDETKRQVIVAAISVLSKAMEHVRSGPSDLTKASTIVCALAVSAKLGAFPSSEAAHSMLSLVCSAIAYVEGASARAISSVTEIPLPSVSTVDCLIAGDWVDCVILEALQATVQATVESMLADDPPSLNTPLADGLTLIHRLAATGQGRCIVVVLATAGPRLDLLSRNRAGATPLQVARELGYLDCVAVLENVTQAAAEACQEALLRELEALDALDSSGNKDGRKAKKKKTATRSTSFASEQPDEKSQKVGNCAPAETEAADALVAAAEEAARMEEHTARRQLVDDEYERALEARRKELSEQVQHQQPYPDVIDIAMSMDSSGDEGPHPAKKNILSDDGTMLGQEASVSPDVRPSTPSELDGRTCENASPFAAASYAAQSGSDGEPGGGGGSSSFGERPYGLESEPSQSLFADMNMDTATNGMNFRQGEHSLFGSPSLTGSLFSGPGATQQQNTTTARLRPPVHNETRLQDALFIANSPAQMQRHDSATLTRESSLFASLQGGLPHDGSGSMMLGAQVVPQASSASAFDAMSMNRMISGSLSPNTVRAPSDAGSDESAEPTRHLWIGNLGTRTPRALLKVVFERHGVVDDVVTFPGRMYAFVNFRSTEEAVAATIALQDQVVSELTGDRPLLLKYRPAKKAAVHLRALGLGMSMGLPDGLGIGGMGMNMGMGLDEGSQRIDLDRDGNCSEPSPRIWLGNIAPTATSKSLHAVLGRFGQLTDAAVFPARIGPLGYAFVKFETLEDAMLSFETLNNTVVPLLSGSKQLKMRYKPATDGPAGRDETSDAAKGSTAPSRHLWLGNVTQKPTEDAIYQIFARFGVVDSIRIFPAKAYAFVNFADIGAAMRAMAELDGLPLQALTGVKPVVMRFQQESASTGNPMPRTHSESHLNLAALHQLVPGAVLGGPLSGSGDSSSEDGVGVVPNGRAGGWVAEKQAMQGFPQRPTHNNIQRSASMGSFLGAHNAAANSGIGQLHTPFGNGDANPHLATLLALQRGQRAGLPGLPPLAPPAQTPTSVSQLSAVLNNLTALQRAASCGLPGHAPAGGGMRPNDLLQLNLMQQQQQQQGGHGMGPANDIARLSSMLAGQSLTIPPSNNNGTPWSSMGEIGSAPMPKASAAAGQNWANNNNCKNASAGVMCPLSGQIMIDPVIAADGITYNRTAIADWMSSKGVSPITKAPLAHACLVPNPGVKSAVVDYLRAQLAVSTS